MTDKSLAQVLKEAVEAIDEAGVPEPLREAAFVKVLDHLLGGTAVPSKAPIAAPSPAASGAGTEPAPSGGASDAEPIAAIASRLHVEQGLVSRVFDVDEDGVHLVVPRSKLDSKKTVAAQEIASLIAGARQAAGVDAEWTSVEEIRRIADEKGVLDTNFSKHIAALNGKGMRMRGGRGKRELKLNDPGFEAAGALVKRLAGEE